LGRDIAEEKNYSEETAHIIDEEVKIIVEGCYQRAKNELALHKDKLQKLAEELLIKETLDESEVRKIIGLPEQESESTVEKTEEKKEKPVVAQATEKPNGNGSHADKNKKQDAASQG